MKRVIITGATGYIGSNLAHKLVELNINVNIISRKSSNYNLIEDIKNKINIFEYDMEIDNLIEFFKNSQADIVFHLASLSIGQHTEQQIDDLINSNLLFSTHILEAMLQSNMKKIINTGTYWQNYENDNYNPTCLYAATKEAFEKILEYYVESENFNAITLKLFDTYGPNDPRNKIINLFNKIAKTGETLDMSGGEQYLDLVYIDDVIDGYIYAMNLLNEQKNIKHNKYFISSGEYIKLKDLAILYEEVNSIKLNINWGKRPYRNREVMKPIINNKLDLLIQNTKVNLKNGLQKTYNCYQNIKKDLE